MYIYKKKKTKIVFTFRTVQTVVNNEPVASDLTSCLIKMNYQVLVVTYGDSINYTEIQIDGDSRK